MSRKGQSVQYRKVRREEEDDLEAGTLGTPGSPCLLPCLFLLLVLIALSLGLLFFLTAPNRHFHSGVHSSSPAPNVTSTTLVTENTDAIRLSSTTKKTTTKEPTKSTHNNNNNNNSSSEEIIKTTEEISNNTTRFPNVQNSTNGINHNETMSQFQSGKEHLIQSIRDLTKYLESVTGLEGELLVPLFMLILFLTAVAIVSCCCCLISRRRERRRRELFGKIITDLQTGDSKRVLLNHSDMDD